MLNLTLSKETHVEITVVQSFIAVVKSIKNLLTLPKTLRSFYTSQDLYKAWFCDSERQVMESSLWCRRWYNAWMCKDVGSAGLSRWTVLCHVHLIARCWCCWCCCYETMHVSRLLQRVFILSLLLVLIISISISIFTAQILCITGCKRVCERTSVFWVDTDTCQMLRCCNSGAQFWHSTRVKFSSWWM